MRITNLIQQLTDRGLQLGERVSEKDDPHEAVRRLMPSERLKPAIQEVISDYLQEDEHDISLKHAFGIALTQIKKSSTLKENINYRPEDTIHLSGAFPILDDMVIEGSSHHQGTQPPYLINTSHPKIQEFFQKIDNHFERFFGDVSSISAVDKIERLIYLVRQSFRHRHYDNVLMHAVAGGVERETPVDFGDYLEAESGVCREHAILTVLGLSYLGFDASYQYVDATHNERNEDHAFAIVRLNGVKWIVDAYNMHFNGLHFQDLLSGKKRIRRKSFRDRYAGGTTGLKMNINAFPHAYVPANALQAHMQNNRS